MAAYDPVFYLHHSNVDRQYAYWQDLQRLRKKSAEATRYYDGIPVKVFISHNCGDGGTSLNCSAPLPLSDRSSGPNYGILLPLIRKFMNIILFKKYRPDFLLLIGILLLIYLCCYFT